MPATFPIGWAVNGQGDERLIAVVDGMTAGSASIDECMECVQGWDSSSGIDALVGWRLHCRGAASAQ